MEPAVLYLTSLSQVMALTGTGIGELTSTLGGLSGWTDSGGNPTQSGHGSQLYQDGSTYYWFWTDGTTVYAQTSTTALPGSWNAKTTLFTKTTIGQAWAAASLWGVCVFRDPNDNTWKALQEGDGSGGYQIGLLTTGSSTLAGATWTPYAGNPLMSLLAPAATWCSHPDVHCNLRGSGTYDLWYHPSYPFDGPGDSLIAHAQSSDLIHWTNLELVLRLNSENFSGLAADQLADPHVYYFNGSCKIYYDIDAEIDIAANVQAATYNNTLANLLVDPPLVTLGAGGPIIPVGLFPSTVRRPSWDYTGSRRAIWSE